MRFEVSSGIHCQLLLYHLVCKLLSLLLKRKHSSNYVYRHQAIKAMFLQEKYNAPDIAISRNKVVGDQQKNEELFKKYSGTVMQ